MCHTWVSECVSGAMASPFLGQVRKRFGGGAKIARLGFVPVSIAELSWNKSKGPPASL